MAMLEQTTLSSKDSGNRRHVVPPNGALAYFLKQYPELAAKYQLTTSKPGTKPKAKKPQADKTRGRSKSSQKSGSSFVSAKSHASRDGKQSSRISSRSESRNSQSSKRGDQQNQGKGKGKGKGKARGRGKNAKKAVRVQTPVPRRNWLRQLRQRKRILLRRRSVWNYDFTIDFDAYVHFRLRRMTLVQSPRDFHIPAYVLAYLANSWRTEGAALHNRS